MGNFLMSSGGGFKDFNQNLINAQKYRRMIIQQYCEAMQDVDFVISPNCFGEKPPKIDDILNKVSDKSPVFEFKMDYFTALTNCLGVPAMTIPLMEDTKYGFPGSIRLTGYFGEDYHLIRKTQTIENILKKEGISVI